ncbi:site-specific integrase [Vibrio parahaemolyticus]|uniref:site-specific integrase n=1 Tax=Vibrio parahaemolyticus TaxID=670 RepID=UPI002361AE32|nr:site-specific integrase [Vibrio parahaemolyticus]
MVETTSVDIKDFKSLYAKYKNFIGLKEFKILFEFCKYKKHKNVSIKTVEDQMNMICKMISIIDKKVNKWTKEDALDVYYKIYKMPDTRNFKSIDKTKRLSNFFDNNHCDYKTISISTANKRLGYLKTYFDWLVEYGYLKRNLIKNLKPLSDVNKDSLKRKAYTEKDLKVIFSDEIFGTKSNARSYKYWVPIIAVLMGMRQNEIAQLFKRDIVFEGGLWAVYIRAGGDGQKVKNKNSIRKIPVHGKLIELGFIDFVNSIEEGQLFKELKWCKKNNYSRYVSRWFSEKKKSWGYGEEYNFHSFRHYLTNEMKQNGEKLCIASEITGHGYDSVAYERYGKEYSLKEKKRVIERRTSKAVKKLKRIYPTTNKTIGERVLSKFSNLLNNKISFNRIYNV